MKCLIGLPPTFMLPVKGFTKPAIACGKCCDPKIFRALNIGSIKNELLTTNLYRISGVAKGGGAVRPWRNFSGVGTMGYAVGNTLPKAVLK